MASVRGGRPDRVREASGERRATALEEGPRHSAIALPPTIARSRGAARSAQSAVPALSPLSPRDLFPSMVTLPLLRVASVLKTDAPSELRIVIANRSRDSDSRVPNGVIVTAERSLELDSRVAPSTIATVKVKPAFPSQVPEPVHEAVRPLTVSVLIDVDVNRWFPIRTFVGPSGPDLVERTSKANDVRAVSLRDPSPVTLPC